MLFLLALTFFFAKADQTAITSYRASKSVFWGELYSRPKNNQMYKSLYCQKPFNRPKGLNVEHVFAASWMKNSFEDCRSKNRKECRRISKRFNLMEADLHNLYPSIPMINSARGSSIFGEIEGEYIYQGCDMKIASHSAEPPLYAKGPVARSILYMANEYSLNIDELTNAPGFESMLLKWHCKYPPSPIEIVRNHRIFELQGTSNLYILEKTSCS